MMLSKSEDVMSGKLSGGPKCPECGNVIDSGNRKLRCKNCKRYFCETCESSIDKVGSYRECKVEVDHPLCEECHGEAVDSGKKRIDAYIRKNKRPTEQTNSIGMKFVLIPGKNYYMGKYTLTQKEWNAVMGSTPWRGKDRVREGDDYPVTYISWDDCQEFVKKLDQREGVNRYRLPTEAEWEHACRAGSAAKYCFGDDVGQLGDYVWCNKNTWDIGEKYAHRVGQKKPNQWGLYDMHGNVCEWTATKEGSFRVFRGGSWGLTADYCVSSYRVGFEPDFRSRYLGVRLVRASDR